MLTERERRNMLGFKGSRNRTVSKGVKQGYGAKRNIEERKRYEQEQRMKGIIK